jgi:predicted nucleotidyltransferase
MERKIIYKTDSGSYLYGTNTENSDKDYTSVFLPTSYDLLSLQKCDFIDNSTKKSSENRRNTEDDIDDKIYSLNRYLSLVLSGNPNLLEILFAADPIICEPVFNIFKDNYDKILSQRVHHTFCGFAFGQIKKLEYKSKRYNQLAKALAYFETNYDPTELDSDDLKMSADVASYLNSTVDTYKTTKHNAESFHEGLPVKRVYERIIEEYNHYGWRTKTQTFASLGYDVKFASHAIRLYHEGAELLKTGKLEFPLSGKALDDIMRIKTGKVSLEEFYDLSDKYNLKSRIFYDNIGGFMENAL